VWKGRYRCTICRSGRGNNCKAALIVIFDPEAEVKLSIDATKANHTCISESSTSSPEERRVEGVFDARLEMRELCSQMALEDTAKSSIQIANDIVAQITAKYTQLGILPIMST
jgi:hypothetical protein